MEEVIGLMRRSALEASMKAGAANGILMDHGLVLLADESSIKLEGDGGEETLTVGIKKCMMGTRREAAAKNPCAFQYTCSDHMIHM